MRSSKTYFKIHYTKSIMGSWSYHYRSWKNYNDRKIIIIKYEDMITKTNETFLKVIKYLNNINNMKLTKKMINAINLTSLKI